MATFPIFGNMYPSGNSNSSSWSMQSPNTGAGSQQAQGAYTTGGIKPYDAGYTPTSRTGGAQAVDGEFRTMAKNWGDTYNERGVTPQKSYMYDSGLSENICYLA